MPGRNDDPVDSTTPSGSRAADDGSASSGKTGGDGSSEPGGTEVAEPSRDPEDPADDEGADDHLADVPDGAGCTEIWEHLGGRDVDGTDE